jgi:MarR family transcriptional regulator, transcriptional regulator for hemolysin
MNKPARPTASLHALLHTAHTAQAHVEARLDAIGLSLAKLAALSALAESGESLPLTQLAERLSCVKSNITQLVDRLEADGFVARQPAPGDRRTRLAVMTAAGRKAWKAGTSIQQQGEREVFSKLTRAQAQQLASLMDKVAAKP